jgi:hypothetical protein
MKGRTLSYFFTSNDEKALSIALRKRFPEMRFIDGAVWNSTTPPVRSSIADCETGLAYLWDPATFATLIVTPREDGKFRGPQTLSVVQFCRCRIEGEYLYLGQASMTIDPGQASQRRFCNAVARIIRNQGAGSLVATSIEDAKLVGAGITNFITGADAYQRAPDDLVLFYGHCRYTPDHLTMAHKSSNPSVRHPR